MGTPTIRGVIVRSEPPGPGTLGAIVLEFGAAAAIGYSSQEHTFSPSFTGRGAEDPEAVLANVRILGAAPGRGVTRDLIELSLHYDLVAMVGDGLAGEFCQWLERLPGQLIGDQPSPQEFRIDMTEELYLTLSEALLRWTAAEYAPVV